MAQQVQSLPLQIHHGHTDDKVLIQFTRPIDHVMMNPAEAEALIAAVRTSIDKLAEHRRAKGN